MGAPNQLVAVRLPPGPGFLGALRRAWGDGDAVLPLEPRLPEPEVARMVEQMRPARLAGGEGEVALPGGRPVAEGVALVVLTSGSSGEPKGVELTHANLQAAAEATARRLGAGPGDRWLCCLPVHHVAGLATLARSILDGSEPVIHPRFDPAAVAAEREATLVSLVPAMLVRLLDAGAALSQFKWILLGGGPIPPGLVARAESAGARVVTTYGMTETFGGVVYDGWPLDGVEVAVRAQGEIALRGPMVMRGYRLRPDLTAAALEGGWLRTADLGELGADGRLRVIGRRDGVITTGGEKVAPEEVEAVLSTHPRVAEAAVAGVPDPEWGQRVVAVVVPAGEAPTLGDLRAFVLDRLAPHNAPRGLVLVERLPRTGSGKVARAEVAALAGEA